MVQDIMPNAHADLNAKRVTTMIPPCTATQIPCHFEAFILFTDLQDNSYGKGPHEVSSPA